MEFLNGKPRKKFEPREENWRENGVLKLTPHRRWATSVLHSACHKSWWHLQHDCTPQTVEVTPPFFFSQDSLSKTKKEKKEKRNNHVFLFLAEGVFLKNCIRAPSCGRLENSQQDYLFC